MLSAFVMWKLAVGFGVIALVFGLFGVLMYLARATHTKRIGGISIWRVLRGQWTRWH